ncbi:class I SAM-dependent methyltransferase [Streptomyces achromogenes]|uniref:class I SAM-dependent methyltransferase n=1 Tax=Streptomyces achromogenes TaxID=67255 RepID=UPI003679882E
MSSRTPNATLAPYSGAVSHYTSSKRRDPVKRLWEEPVTRGLLSRALRYVGPLETTRILDVGSGAGEGVNFLLAMDENQSWHSAEGRYRYCGLDLDESLLDTARVLHRRRPEVSFVHADMREYIPDEPYDLYFSSGVPYSHLTPRELTDVLSRIFTAVRRNRTRSVVVVDVLGRYSIEWADRWDRQRWDYTMSFFQGGRKEEAPTPTVPMTFWDAWGLRRVIDEACAQAGQHYEEVSFHDRSIMVGRHTQTREFNPGIPPYRLLVNRLERGDDTVEPMDLRFPYLPTGTAPDRVLNFFDAFQEQWQALLETDFGRLPDGIAASMLACGLRRLEHSMAPGLGVGHSLTALVHLDGGEPARNTR